MTKRPTAAQLAAMTPDEFAEFVWASGIKTLSHPDVTRYLDGRKLDDPDVAVIGMAVVVAAARARGFHVVVASDDDT